MMPAPHHSLGHRRGATAALLLEGEFHRVVVFTGERRALSILEEHAHEVDARKLVDVTLELGVVSVAKRVGWALEHAAGGSPIVVEPLRDAADDGLWSARTIEAHARPAPVAVASAGEHVNAPRKVLRSRVDDMRKGRLVAEVGAGGRTETRTPDGHLPISDSLLAKNTTFRCFQQATELLWPVSPGTFLSSAPAAGSTSPLIRP